MGVGYDLWATICIGLQFVWATIGGAYNLYWVTICLATYIGLCGALGLPLLV